MAVILLRFQKEKVFSRIIMLGVAAVLSVVFCFYCFSNHQYLHAIKTDIEQCSFVTYSGSFVHDDFQRDSFYHSLLIDWEGENSKILRYPDYGNQYQLHEESRAIPVGTWTGTVVYGENSHVVVYCIWEED